ncbi:MAG: Mrp/NBP35 family ATP-binding protein [Planctomycetes bacterium]|nr:Mrp/NBP35 family ATP-binding protein [Planctomycetota bacterium]
MTFDKEKVLQQIDERLRKIPLPGSPGNPISAGLVERIIAHQGQVNLVMNFPSDLVRAKGEIKAAVESAVAAIDGVSQVQVLEKVQPQQAAATAPAPGARGAGVGAQGVPGVRHIVAVASAKGGVGKSTVAVNLAAELGKRHRVGLLDADVYGPSIPMMLGILDERPSAAGGDRFLPIAAHGIKTMSIGFLLDDDAPVIWRGPMVTNLLRQFLFQVDWGELDYLVVDLPPGTGDAQLTMVQSIALSGGLIVTTPQNVALLDVQRGIQMFQRVEVPILGVIENMSVFVCPHCKKETEIFPAGGGKRAARRYDVPFLGSIPLEARYATSGDRGMPTVLADSESSLAKTIAAVASTVIEELG